MPENTKIAKPGDNLSIRAKLHFPLTITKGSRFALREGGKTIADNCKMLCSKCNREKSNI